MYIQGEGDLRTTYISILFIQVTENQNQHSKKPRGTGRGKADGVSTLLSRLRPSLRSLKRPRFCDPEIRGRRAGGRGSRRQPPSDEGQGRAGSGRVRGPRAKYGWLWKAAGDPAGGAALGRGRTNWLDAATEADTQEGRALAGARSRERVWSTPGGTTGQIGSSPGTHHSTPPPHAGRASVSQLRWPPGCAEGILSRSGRLPRTPSSSHGAPGVGAGAAVPYAGR
jgi:hypothetical protein